jgi:hypothetical protein
LIFLIKYYYYFLLLFLVFSIVNFSVIMFVLFCQLFSVDDVKPPLSPSAMRNFGNPPPNPMMYAVNPYTGLLSQPYPNFQFWPFPLYKPASSFSDADDVTATSPESRQQNVACGKGPTSLPQRKNPTVGIVGGSEAERNSWPFIVSLS